MDILTTVCVSIQGYIYQDIIYEFNDEKYGA